MPSPFPPRGRSRGMLLAQATQQVFREVRNEDELRAALQPLAPDLVASTGRRIVMTQPMTFKRTVVVPASLPGVIIESHGMLPISPGVDGMDAFEIRAPTTTIRNLYLLPDLERQRYFGRAFVIFREPTSGLVPAGLRVHDVDAIGVSQMLVDLTSDRASDGWLDRVYSNGGQGNADGVSINSAGWRVTSSQLRGSGTGISLRLGVDAERCALIGNNFFSGDVDTSLSLGLNVISSNTDCGVITSAFGDAVGLNT